jgi:hypothetical protein
MGVPYYLLWHTSFCWGNCMPVVFIWCFEPMRAAWGWVGYLVFHQDELRIIRENGFNPFEPIKTASVNAVEVINKRLN